MSDSTRISVGGEAPYDVLIGTDLLDDVAPTLGGAHRVAVVHPRALANIARDIAKRLTHAGYDAHAIEVPDGEAGKDIRVADFCWSVLGTIALTRTDAIVGIGGGATTDLAGFVAATWLRGVRVVLVPTTLLGMVDAAVGGKTAVNTEAGKNLVGAFHPPAAVIADIELLRGMPHDDYISGLAEVVKAGFIADPTILDLVESDPIAATNPHSSVTRELIERAVAVKARVVTQDLKERGGREVLNYGHTLGHAIERAEDYQWRHGSAIAVGMCYAAEVSRRARGLDDATVARHRSILSAVGLPTTYQRDAWPRLHGVMRVDKKTRGDRLRFVVLDAIARPSLLEDPDPALLEDAYVAVSA